MPTQVSELPPRFDVFSASSGQLYDRYRELRAASALCRGGPGTYVVPRHADVLALLRDDRLGHHVVLDEGTRERVERERVGDAAKPNGVLTRLIAGMDPPQHTRVRQLVHTAMRRGGLIERVAAAVPSHVEALLGVALERGCVEAVEELALALQVRVAAELLGIPACDRAYVTKLATDLGRAIILLPFVRAEWGNGDAEAAALREYVLALQHERSRRLGDDAISCLLSARFGDDALDRDEVADNAVFLFFAGFETTVNLLATGCELFTRFPEQLVRLRREPGLARGAVDEILRIEAPLQWVSRITKEPLQVSDRSVGARRVLLLLLGSANHDEREFAEPERFDIERSPNPHVTLGGGHHACMGRNLLMAEGVDFFARLASCVRGLEPTAPALRREHPCIRGFRSVPIQLHPA